MLVYLSYGYLMRFYPSTRIIRLKHAFLTRKLNAKLRAILGMKDDPSIINYYYLPVFGLKATSLNVATTVEPAEQAPRFSTPPPLLPHAETKVHCSFSPDQRYRVLHSELMEVIAGKIVNQRIKMSYSSLEKCLLGNTLNSRALYLDYFSL
jgi:hypothetical protein